MKKYLLVIVFITGTTISFAQKKAVTETGEEVVLYDDGTWKYAKESDKEEVEIPMNPTPFKKSIKSTFQLKSTKFNVAVWLDSKKWSFKKAGDDEDAEYELQLRGKDLYGMIISESIEIPLETMKSVALENAKGVSPDIRVVKEEYRMVNGKKILVLQLTGSTSGIKFTYYGYYYSNANGTVQFVTYTAQRLFDGLKAEAEELLNGLVETEE